jgi:hypothetical protein
MAQGFNSVAFKLDGIELFRRLAFEFNFSAAGHKEDNQQH